MSGAGAEPIVEAVGLTRHFKAKKPSLFAKAPLVRAVENVSFQVRRGETFAIVGESGCGKSTLSRLLLRLIEPTAGAIRFEGRDITALPAEEMRRLRRRMQMIFQDPYASLNPRMSVGELIGEPLSVHGIASGKEKAARVSELLAKVGLLPDYANRYPHEFSGGQRQRIGIARALACGPCLLIGDEPVSALDVSIRAQVINLLEDLKAAFGLTIILVAHDLAVIRHTSDRVAVMYLGEIVELADAATLFARPLHPYTRMLMAAIPVPDPRARSAEPVTEGDLPSPTAPPPGCRFHPRCPHARERCRQEHPSLRDSAVGHAVACHFAEEIAAGQPAGLAPPPESQNRRRRIALFAAAQAAGGAAPPQ